MNTTIEAIPIARLALTFLPVLVVLVLLYMWSKEARESVYGLSRMLAQLLIIGYFLAFLIDSDSALIIVTVLAVMVLVSSWIALRTTNVPRKELYVMALGAILVGGGIPLVIVTQFVLVLDPWYAPRFMIPLAGMIFGNAMTSVSLAAERMESEISRGTPYGAARAIALKTSMIPITNALFAVGLVSLPGMMTGQILSGVSPLIAVRYQIMVMAMLFAADGLAAALFLALLRPHLAKFRMAG